jgi:A/G-specific adenine glycosylase
MRSGIPATREELSRVPGLGPYTVGAILSFAFHQKAPAVDANVVRVMARFDAIEEEVTTPRIRREIEERVSQLLPDEEPWIIGEALIELGALVCTKEPQCLSCPLRSECLGIGRGDLPKKRKGKGVTLLYRAVAIVETARGYIVSKAPEGRVMAGLWHFPYIELERPPADLESMRSHFEAQFEAPLTYVKSLEPLTHTFTRYKAHLFPSLWRAPDLDTGVSIDELHALPFTSGHRTLRSLVRNQKGRVL